MSTFTVFHEAIMSVFCRSWKYLLVLLSLTVLLSAAPTLNLLVTAQTVRTLEARISAGSNVLIVTSNGGSVDAATCLALNSNSTILHAGTVNSHRVTALRSAPGAVFERATVSPEYLDIVSPHQRKGTNGAYLGSAIAQELSISFDAPMEFIDGQKTTAVAPINDLRDETRKRWVFVTQPPGLRASECWIEAKPGAADDIRALIPGVFHLDSELKINTLIANDDSEIRDTWKTRPSQFAGITSGVLTAFLLALLLWSRRSEYALYSLVGFSTADTVRLAVFEQLFYLVPALLLSTAVWGNAWIWCTGGELLSLRTALTQSLFAYSVAALLLTIPALLITRGNLGKAVRNHE